MATGRLGRGQWGSETGAVTGPPERAAEATMAEGPEKARGRPPGQDDGGGDHEPVPSRRGLPAAAPRPRDGPQAEPQAPGRPPAPGLGPPAAATEESEPPREPENGREAGSASGSGPGSGSQAPAGCEAPEAAAPREKPARLSAREYSRQVHEWLWQSYCGYLTWHSGLAAFPAYCSPQPPAPSYLAGAGAAAASASGPPPLQLGYYNPFYFLSAAAAGPEPPASAGLTASAPVAGPGARAPHVQPPARAAPATRVGPAAASRAPSETGRQAGERLFGERPGGGAGGPLSLSPPPRSPRLLRVCQLAGCTARPCERLPLDLALQIGSLAPRSGGFHVQRSLCSSKRPLSLRLHGVE